MKGVFLASIEDNIAAEFGLKDVVSVENLGTKLLKSQLGDALSRGSQVHKYWRWIMALKIGDEDLEQLAEGL